MTDSVDAGPEDRARQLGSVAERLRSKLKRWEPAVPLFGGFGFGAAVVVPLFWPDWPFAFLLAVPLVALVAGVVYRHNPSLAYVGFAAAGTIFPLLYHSLSPVDSSDYTFVWIVYIALLLITAAAFAVPGLMAHGTRPVDRGQLVPAVVGAIALFLAALTAVQVAASPFEISLPAGWNIVEYPRYASRDPAYGEQYTAVLGSAAVAPSQANPPTSPVVGITVVRAGIRQHMTSSDCAAISLPVHSRLYGAALGPTGEVTLPAGVALMGVVLPDDGSRVYSWSLPTNRIVGVLPLDMCYVLVVTVPPGSHLTEADATAIVSSIRFP